MNSVLIGTLVFLILLFVQGCAPKMSTYENRIELNIERLEQEKLIGMSKQEVFKKFGPPLAVARKGGPDLYIPRVFEKGSERFSPDMFLKKFENAQELNNNDIIYYYQQTSLYGYGFIFQGGAHHPANVIENQVIHRLWLLFDEHTGDVIDYILEKGR